MKWIFKSGILFPFIGKRRLPVNRDGSPFDSGEFDLLDELEKAPFYVEVWVLEWAGIGVPIWPWSLVYDAKTGVPVPPRDPA